MTALDDLLMLLGSAYDSVAREDVSSLMALVAADAVCVVIDEVELRQERQPLAAMIARLDDLVASGHRVFAGGAAQVSHTGDRVWVTDLATVVLPDGTQHALQVTLLATIGIDGALLVDQVNLSAPDRGRAAAPLNLVG